MIHGLPGLRRLLWALAVASSSAAPAQEARRTTLPDSGSFFVLKELRLLDLPLTIGVPGDPDCDHGGFGTRGGWLAFHRTGPITMWVLADTVVRCESRVVRVTGERRDSGFVSMLVDDMTIVLSSGGHSPMPVAFAQLHWLGATRDSLVLIGAHESRRAFYVAAAPPAGRPH